MTLWFVGTGISGYDTIPAAGIRAIEGARTVYVERFTSPVPDGDLDRIRAAAGGEVVEAKRWMVEDGEQILGSAEAGPTVLVSYGDPYIATTHAELRVRAERRGIRTGTVNGSSAVTSIVGQCGLHYYKMGRVATVMSGAPARTPYYVTYRNMVEGNHTALLLEYDQDGGSHLPPGRALEMLLESEEEQGRGAFSGETFAVVACRAGGQSQRIVSGSADRLKGMDFGGPPHTVIIPGMMHFTESEALPVLTECLDPPRSNSENTEKIAVQMIKKYVPMVTEALEEAEKRGVDPSFAPVLENARLYIRDAEAFLEQGKDEVAVLSIGYADGLVDALRMASGLDPKM